MNQYEAMFLFDPTFAQSFENCENEIQRIMARAEAEILFCRKWDERRLAFKVKGRKRGVYVLVFFKAPPGKIAALERDARLSEHVLRVLILRAEGMTPEMMERAASPRVVETGEGDYEGRESRDRRGAYRGEEREALGFPQRPRSEPIDASAESTAVE